jgi:hypothetical protein
VCNVEAAEHARPFATWYWTNTQQVGLELAEIRPSIMIQATVTSAIWCWVTAQANCWRLQYFTHRANQADSHCCRYCTIYIWWFSCFMFFGLLTGRYDWADM